MWRSVVKGLPEGFEFDERELAILGLAGRQADDVAALEGIMKRDSRMVAGSKGQPRLHPAVVEVRQGRLAISRMLGELELPDAEEQPRSATSRRAGRAARARYDRVASLEARRALFGEGRGGAA